MRRALQKKPDDNLNIQVSVNGTEPSRRVAEVAIADSENMSIRTAVTTDTATDAAIVNKAKRRKNKLIAMGVGHRHGGNLYVGDTAAAPLLDAENTLLFMPR